MKKYTAYILALGLMLIAGSAHATDQCANAAKTKSSAAINIATATTTQLAAAGNSAIHVCGWSLTLAASNTIQFVFGTGVNCGTGQTVLTGAYTLGSAAGYMSYGGPDAEWAYVPTGNALCAVTTGATFSAQGIVTFVRE